ncbi:endocuticle structural glycoprotein SgAbd-2, partial [Copidosoma floridanum]|uniref:endocuticle structural glycoprotein SgAbd-2 n=1 Tax=Copidosoma floridanum TaxID=29053 RepID=UPI0006C956A2
SGFLDSSWNNTRLKTVLFALLALTYGQQDLYFRQPEKLLRNTNNVGDRLGEYAFAYETEGGILQSEMGSRKYEGTDSETQLIQGSVQYNDPNGEPVVFSYTADEYGTRVVGSHVPTPPPIPESVANKLLGFQESFDHSPSGTYMDNPGDAREFGRNRQEPLYFWISKNLYYRYIVIIIN